jgi:endonuclease-3
MQADVATILTILDKMYPGANCELEHQTPFELLVATILSAQATDKKVNEITSVLFRKYNTAEQFAKLSVEELEKEIRQIGLSRTKSRNIIAAAKLIMEQHAGEVPRTREELEALPGVGRKTANVVLSTAFGVPTIAVDTHVFRVANRLGLADSADVRTTEEQLMLRIPQEQWISTHHGLIWHGRRLCFARKPNCVRCDLLFACKEGENFL